MLPIDVNELWDRHFHLVRAPDEVSLFNLALVLDALRRLVVLERVIDWIGDRRESLLLLAIAELFLLYLDLVCDNDVAIQVHGLDQDRYDELLDNALLLVIDGCADV